MISTLLFGGVDLSAIDGVLVSDLSGMWAPMTRRGQYDTIPGRDGQVGSPLPFDSYQFTVPVVIDGATEVELNTRILGLGAALAGVGGLGTLTRRLAAAGGTVDYTAAGVFGGLSGMQFTGTAIDGEFEVQCDLLFTNLDGGWKRVSDNVVVRP
jgi:hypothetical protein